MKVRDEGRDYGNSRMQKKLRDLVDKGDVGTYLLTFIFEEHG